MKANTRLAGHGLRHEGRVYLDPWAGYVANIAGRAKCECGALSRVLPNANQRKIWHRAHKESVK